MEETATNKAKRAVSKRKSDWIKSCDRYERSTYKLLQDLEAQVSGQNKSIRIATRALLIEAYRINDHQGVGLGPRGVKILEDAIRLGMSKRVILDIHIPIQILEVISGRLAKEAEAQWGKTATKNWPYFEAPSLNLEESLRDAQAAKTVRAKLDRFTVSKGEIK